MLLLNNKPQNFKKEQAAHNTSLQSTVCSFFITLLLITISTSCSSGGTTVRNSSSNSLMKNSTIQMSDQNKNNVAVDQVQLQNKPIISPTAEVKIETLIERWFGKQLTADKHKKPFYYIGDFNGDKKSDIAVILELKAKPNELSKEFQILNPWLVATEPEAKDILKTDSKYVLGIVHGGSENDWKNTQPMAKFILLDAVYDEMRLVKYKGRSTNDDLPEEAKGDGIYTGTEEAGGIIYWDGSTYRWEQMGD